MSSPAWSVYECDWGLSPDDACSALPPDRTLRGCGLRRVDVIQRGAQGVVYLARDSAGALFAVKRLFTPRSDFGARGLSEGALREATLLAHVAARAGAAPRVVRLHRIVEAPHGELCLVLEHCPLDLSRLVRRRRRRAQRTRHAAEAAPARCAVLAEPLVVRLIVRDVLRALQFLHDECHIVHRDVKLSNVLVREDGTLRLSDFGSARLMCGTASSSPSTHEVHGEEEEKEKGGKQKEEERNEGDGELTPAALRTTLIYQAPECLMGHRGGTWELDMWAAGVVFAELLLQQHLFKEQSELGVLAAIWKMLGAPKEGTAVGGISVGPAVESEPTIALKFPSTIVSPDGFDLLQKMLQVDPARRISAAEALRHSFLQLNADDEEAARRMWQGKVQTVLEEASRPVKVGMQELSVDVASDFADEDEEDDIFIF